MSLRKVFSIIIASVTLLLFIFSFAPHVDYGKWAGSANLWDGNKAQPIMFLLAEMGIIAVYLLHILINLKDKWVQFANYGVGFISLSYLTMFFTSLDNLGFGLVIGVILALGIIALSVVWYFMSDKPFSNKSTAPITGYDPKTGKPIYAKPKGFDPETGKPIYE
jgi:hypothetical protein